MPREGATATSGLVEVPRDTRGDSELSFGGVSITGAIGEGGRSWEIQLMRGVGLGLEIQDMSGLDIEWGAVGVVNFTGVGGALAVVKIVSKCPEKMEDIGSTYYTRAAGTSALTRSWPRHIH